MKKKDLQFAIIENMRLPLVLMVIFIHAFSSVHCVPEEGLDYYLFKYFESTLSLVVSHIAVPIFFLFSGFLFFINIERLDISTYKRKIKSRLFSIIVPYLVWNLLYAIFLFSKLFVKAYLGGDELPSIISFFNEQGGFHMFWDCNIWNLDRVNWVGYTIPASAPVLIPLWFLRDLIIISFITPVIFFCIKKIRVLYFMVLLVGYLLNLWPYIPGLEGDALLFYSIGACVAIENDSLQVYFSRYKLSSYILFFTLLIPMVILMGHTTYWGNIIYPFFITIGVYAALNLFTELTTRRGGHFSYCKYSKATFFIYAVHTILILDISIIVVNRIIPLSNGCFSILKYTLIPLLTLIISLGLFITLNKIMKPILAVLTGNRN